MKFGDPLSYPPLSPGGHPLAPFRRYRDIGVTGEIAKHFDAMSDQIDALELRHAKLVRLVRLMTFGVGALLIFEAFR